MEQLNQEPETDMTAAEYFNGEGSPLTLDKILQPQERDFLLEHIELYAQGKVNQFKISLEQRDKEVAAEWDTEKPVADHEFIMVTKTKFRDYWEYNVWMVKKVQHTDEGWYYALCNGEGEEWGPYEDLTAQFYKII